MADATRTLTGVLKINVDEDALKVSLTFEETSDGDNWTEEGVIAAIEERGIDVRPPRERLAAFLRRASTGGEGPVTEVIVEGTPPVQPEPDTPIWESLPVPDELEEIAERAVAEADPPLIMRTVRETIEREKEVARKSTFPFLKEKTEKKTVREAVEREEKVFVDPTVRSVLYAPADTLIARITPQSTGLPGRDVYGRQIPTRKIADPVFYAGSDVKRERDELHSVNAGFVRIGHNWADIVPFKSHSWSVELSDDRATCYLVFSPGHRLCTPPAVKEILQAATELSYPLESLTSGPEIEKLIQEQIDKGEATRINISSSRDASFDIYVTDDRLEAYLNVHKGKGRGKPLTLREIGTAIKESKLKNLDFEKIKTDISAFYESTEMDLTGYLLCKGKAPTRGAERQAEYSITFDPETKTQRIRENLKQLLESTTPEDNEEIHLASLEEFPAQEIQKTAEVTTEQLLCTLDPPTPGEPGVDVYGATIPAEPGPTPEIRLFENVKKQNSVIVTAAAGVLDFRESEGTVFLRVRAHKDATIEVTVSKDKMEALLSLEEGTGSGARLSRENIDEKIALAKVAYGLNEEAITKALDAARAGAPVKNLTVARGTGPIDQSDNEIEFLTDVEKSAPVRIRKDGSADYRTRGNIVTVKKGQEICRILPSRQEPVDGTNVLGGPVPAEKRGGNVLEIGSNLVREEDDDGTVLVRAEIDGEIQYKDKRIELLATHTVKGDVDMSVGNIRFPGSVIIGGTVRSGFYVVSTGDIKIGGGVEGALISSDGDILIKDGVKGTGKAVLRSKKTIMSPFVELATVLAVGDLVLKSALVRSRIKCNGKISFRGDTGRIVGGTIRARNGFEVSSVGSARGVKTQLSFGQDYLIADLIEKEETEIEKVKRQITQVDLEMRKSEKSHDTNALETLRKEKVKLLKLMEKRGLRLFTLRERFEQHFPSRIVVKDQVHIGTVFESHGRTFEITAPRKAIAVEFNPRTGNIDVSDLSDQDETRPTQE